jgi:hypothetical protein
VFSDSPHQPFAALPIQVKIHTGAGLMIQRKYEKFGGLVYGVIWQALEKKPRFFLFDYPEAMTLLPEGCTSTECRTSRTDLGRGQPLQNTCKPKQSCLKTAGIGFARKWPPPMKPMHSPAETRL